MCIVYVTFPRKIRKNRHVEVEVEVEVEVDVEVDVDVEVEEVGSFGLELQLNFKTPNFKLQLNFKLEVGGFLPLSVFRWWFFGPRKISQ